MRDSQRVQSVGFRGVGLPLRTVESIKVFFLFAPNPAMRARFFPPKTFEILAAASRKVNLFYLFDLGFTFCIASCLTRIPSYAYSRRSPYDHAALLLHDLGSRPRHSLEEAFSSRTGRIASRPHLLPATETQCLCSPGRRPSSRASSRRRNGRVS